MTETLKTSTQKRAEYFEKMELGEPPVSSEDRLDLATRLVNDRQPPDYQTAFMLFDPELDSEHAQWLSLMSYLYFVFDNIKNETMAISLAEKAVELGHLRYSAYLCQTFLYGYYGTSVDLNKAYKYFDKIQDDENILVSGCELIRKILERDGLATRAKKITSSTAIKILDHLLDANIVTPKIGYNNEDLDNAVKVLTQLARGFLDRGNPEDRTKAKDIYSLVSSIKTEDTKEISVSKRAMIALSVFNGEKYSEVKRIQERKHFYSWCDCHTCSSRNNDLFSYINKKKTKDDIYATAFLSRYFSSESNPYELLEHFENNQISKSELKLIEIIATLARYEEWPSARKWDAFKSICAVKFAGLDPDIVRASSCNFGPFYNEVDDNGLPIIGAYDAVNYGDSEGNGLLKSGRGFFKGLTATQNGGINFQFEPANTEFVTDEDIDVILALSFAQEDLQWPSIDLSFASCLHTILQEKKTNPSWVLHTDFGKTLYVTDKLSGALSWSFNKFSVMNGDDIKAKNGFLNLRRKLQAVDAPSPTPERKYTPVVNTNPKGSSAYGVRTGNHFSVGVNFLEFGIDGGHYVETGKQDAHLNGWVFRNDTTYEHQQRTQILTENFNMIAVTIPVFERLRQLTSVMHGVQELKKLGFKPSRHLLNTAKDAEARFKAREKEMKEDRYAYYLPMNRELSR